MAFENYIISDNNVWAYKIALNLLDNSGSSYSPLFIYGDSGTGKTRLLLEMKQAIGEKGTDKVVYCSAEQFGNDFVEVIQEKKTLGSFNDKYGTCEVLLIDEFDFLIDKPAFQTRFFKEFDVLYLAGKRIVIASNLSANEMNLSERYKSRLKMGVVIELTPPDYDARFEFVSRMMETKGISIEPDAIEYICQNITENYRELEGAINTIGARKAFDKSSDSVSMKEVREFLKHLVIRRGNAIDADIVVAVICDYFNISMSELLGRERRRDVLLARQIACYLCRSMTDDITLEEIGNLLGRDHSTIIHSIHKMENELKGENGIPLKKTMDSIIAEVKRYHHV